VVLLPNRSDHVPVLDIYKIVNNIPTPIPHDIDITTGIRIALNGGQHQGVFPKDNSFGNILNLQDPKFHDGKLELKMPSHHGPIVVEITDGAFFSAALTSQPLIRFEVTGKLPDEELQNFADIVGADITLTAGSSVDISDHSLMPHFKSLPFASGTRYAVAIQNHPVPGHHPPFPTHPEPNHREVTHFYFYYELLNDQRSNGPRFDLAFPIGGGVPPQNCDPVLIEPSS
jgi:hypothetical protein